MLNKIFCGNCSEVMKKIPDNYVDLTVTSPPYDNLRNYKCYSFNFKEIAKELFRVTKPGGVVVWVVGDATVNGSETGTSFKQALYFKEIGFNLHDTMIYAKKNPVPFHHNRYIQSFEYMFVLSKGKLKTFNPLKEKTKHYGIVKKRYLEKKGLNDKKAIQPRNKETIVNNEKIKNNIFFYAVGIEKESETKTHTAIFPEKLAEDHILSWSNKGDTVLDPMCGSGTVLKMAKLNNRNYIGIDCSDEYCKISEERTKNINPLLNFVKA